ncbi:hypothetical protein AMTR_s00051p00183770 [Amborella trichopoda]|uniref:Uncharacterized protein n=1 Tax=Amborella trichopoda TaxID=13333 RepID=U5D2M3_AMBTC|nr:hypothetical protein AMTR_s00051p00183770 [Amborella trichopoda]
MASHAPKPPALVRLKSVPPKGRDDKEIERKRKRGREPSPASSSRERERHSSNEDLSSTAVSSVPSSPASSSWERERHSSKEDLSSTLHGLQFRWLPCDWWIVGLDGRVRCLLIQGVARDALHQGLRLA